MADKPLRLDDRVSNHADERWMGVTSNIYRAGFQLPKMSPISDGPTAALTNLHIAQSTECRQIAEQPAPAPKGKDSKNKERIEQSHPANELHSSEDNHIGIIPDWKPAGPDQVQDPNIAMAREELNRLVDSYLQRQILRELDEQGRKPIIDLRANPGGSWVVGAPTYGKGTDKPNTPNTGPNLDCSKIPIS